MIKSSKHPILKTSVALIAGMGLAFAGNAAADEFTGTIDGEEHTWYIVDGEDNPSGTFSAIGLDGDVYMVNIMGHQDDGHTGEDVGLPSEGSLQLRFTRSDDNESVGPPHVDFYDTGELYPSYTNDDDGTLQIDSISHDDDQLSVSGSYTGTLQRIEQIGGALDSGDSVELEVEFDLVLKARDG